MNQPLLWYEGDQTDSASQRGLFANHQGSIAAVADSTGNAIAINGYDAYGIPNETNIGRFQYTGQIWLPELGLYYYKARIYSPTLGRFLQTDPIGYEDQYNLYAYVGNDPVNFVDPTGLEISTSSTTKKREDGTSITTKKITFTAAVNSDGGQLNGKSLSSLASDIETAIEDRFNGGSITDSDGNTTNYVFDAQITTGDAKGNQHQISVIGASDKRLGNARPGRIILGRAPGFEKGKNIFLNEKLLSGTNDLGRVVAHEFGHAGGLRHTNARGNLLNPSPKQDGITNTQRSSIYNRFTPRGVYTNPYTGGSFR